MRRSRGRSGARGSKAGADEKDKKEEQHEQQQEQRDGDEEDAADMEDEDDQEYRTSGRTVGSTVYQDSGRVVYGSRGRNKGTGQGRLFGSVINTPGRDSTAGGLTQLRDGSYVRADSLLNMRSEHGSLAFARPANAPGASLSSAGQTSDRSESATSKHSKRQPRNGSARRRRPANASARESGRTANMNDDDDDVGLYVDNDDAFSDDDDDDSAARIDAREFLEELRSAMAQELEHSPLQAELDMNRLQLVASLVPARMIRHHMTQPLSANAPHQVFSERFEAAALFADISGFSSLAEQLVKNLRGNEAEAAENLSRYIGLSLQKMVRAICRKGGDVVKFAGDAILAIFPAAHFNGSLREAVLCASQVALELVRFPLSQKRDAVSLSVHCGLGCGELVGYHVGGVHNRWEYVVAGPPIEQIKSAEPEAKAGQTVVSPQVQRLLGDALAGTELASGNVLLGDVMWPLFDDKALVTDDLHAFCMAAPQQSVLRLHGLLLGYVPAPARACIETGNDVWAGELRACSTVFLRLLGLRFGGGADDLELVQQAFEVVHRHIAEQEGTLLRFIIDDKGASVLSAFGLPPLKHESDARRAVKASMAVHAELQARRAREKRWDVGCSVGITSGEVFCGTVGGALRAEYTVHGVKVNLAARFMMKTSRSIYCCQNTFVAARKHIKFKSAKLVEVKGVVGKVEVFRPKQQNLVVSLFDQRARTDQVGRKEEQRAVRRMLTNVLSWQRPIPRALVVTGDAGMGKTRLCQYAFEQMKRSPWVTLFARGDDTETHSPLFVWRSIISQLLQAFAGERKLAHLDEAERMQLLISRLPASADAFAQTSAPADDDDDGDDDDMTREPALRRPGPRGNGTAGAEHDGDEEEEEEEEPHLRRTDASTRLQAFGSAEIPADVPAHTRELLALAVRLLPDFFTAGRGRPGGALAALGNPALAGGAGALGPGGEGEAGLVRLVNLLVNMLVKAASDLEQGHLYFDASDRGIASNKNVVRICIIVENLQWIDAHSAECLYRLVERAEPIAILMTARASPGPSGAGDAVNDWFLKTCALPTVVRMELQLLDTKEMAECVRLWTGAKQPVPQALAALVFAKSGGWPLFGYEQVRLMLESDMIHVEGGVCHVSRDVLADSVAVPGSIFSIMTSRLDKIPLPQQLTLKVASVIGAEFKLHVLASVLLRYTGDDDEDEDDDEEDARQQQQQQRRRAESESESPPPGPVVDKRDPVLRDLAGLEAAIGSAAGGRTSRRRTRERDSQQRASRRQEKMLSLLEQGAAAARDGDEENDDGEQRGGGQARGRRHGSGSNGNGNNASGAGVAVAGDLRGISQLLTESIHDLVERGFLERADPASAGGSNVLRFSSVMLRDSAYKSLTYKVRKGLHVKVAEHFEDTCRDYLQPVYFLLAQHYFDADAVDRAVYFLEIAGNDALDIHAMDHVWQCFSRLQRLVDKHKTEVARWRRASWCRKLAEAYMYFGRSEPAEAQLRAALDLLGLGRDFQDDVGAAPARASRYEGRLTGLTHRSGGEVEEQRRPTWLGDATLADEREAAEAAESAEDLALMVASAAELAQQQQEAEERRREEKMRAQQQRRKPARVLSLRRAKSGAAARGAPALSTAAASGGPERRVVALAAPAAAPAAPAAAKESGAAAAAALRLTQRSKSATALPASRSAPGMETALQEARRLSLDARPSAGLGAQQETLNRGVYKTKFVRQPLNNGSLSRRAAAAASGTGSGKVLASVYSQGTTQDLHTERLLYEAVAGGPRDEDDDDDDDDAYEDRGAGGAGQAGAASGWAAGGGYGTAGTVGSGSAYSGTLSRGGKGPRTLFQRIFRERSRKKQLRGRQAFVQRTMRTYRRVENTEAFASIRGDGLHNVEALLEASKIFELLASLVLDPRDPLGLERRFNSMTLAKAAYECSSERPNEHPERLYADNSTGRHRDDADDNRDDADADGPRGTRSTTHSAMLELDLNDHKIENRTLDPRSSSLDQLAHCYAGQALFFAGLHATEWARDISDEYADKAERLYPRVRSPSTKGAIALKMGEYALLVGDHARANYRLERATWIFGFLSFQKEKMSALEMHIVQQFFAGSDLRDLRRFSRRLFADGAGIQCVHTLCAQVELLCGCYAQCQGFLEPVLDHSLEFLGKRDVLDSRETLQIICEGMAEHLRVTDELSGGLDALVVLASLMQRRFGKPELALLVLRHAAEMASEHLHFDRLSITTFHVLVAVFQAFAESFSGYSDLALPGRDPGGRNASRAGGRAASAASCASLAWSPVAGSSLTRPRRSLGADSVTAPTSVAGTEPGDAGVRLFQQHGSLLFLPHAAAGGAPGGSVPVLTRRGGAAGGQASPGLAQHVSEQQQQQQQNQQARKKSQGASSGRSMYGDADDTASAPGVSAAYAPGLPGMAGPLSGLGSATLEGPWDAEQQRVAMRLQPQWLKKETLRAVRKQSVRALQGVLDAVNSFADMYDVCLPCGTYCQGVLAMVKANRRGGKAARALFEKSAEQAHARGQQRLKCMALLEVAAGSGNKAMLAQLAPKFVQMHASFEVRRIAHEQAQL